LFTAPTGGIDGMGVPSDETQVALLQDVLDWDPSNTSLADYVNNFAEQHNATQPEINDAVALLQTGSYDFFPTELAQVDRRSATSTPSCLPCTPMAGSPPTSAP
jgi:hypothetical protein